MHSPQKTSHAVPNTPPDTAPYGTLDLAKLRGMVDELRRERASQQALNRHAKLSRDEAEQYAEIAAHHATRAQTAAAKAERIARTMPDPIAIVLIAVGASTLITLVFLHLSGANHAQPITPTPGSTHIQRQ